MLLIPEDHPRLCLLLPHSHPPLSASLFIFGIFPYLIVICLSLFPPITHSN